MKNRFVRHLSKGNKNNRSHVTKSTIGEQRRITPKDIKVASPGIKRLSPKLTPKLKLTLINSDKKDEMRSNDKIDSKSEGQSTNKKNEKVIERIGHFEANFKVNENADNTEVVKVEANDAFEALMSRGFFSDF